RLRAGLFVFSKGSTRMTVRRAPATEGGCIPVLVTKHLHKSPSLPEPVALSLPLPSFFQVGNGKQLALCPPFCDNLYAHAHFGCALLIAGAAAHARRIIHRAQQLICK